MLVSLEWVHIGLVCECDVCSGEGMCVLLLPQADELLFVQFAISLK